MPAIIQKFRVQHPDIELQHIASSKNLRFHGRFHIAYMLEEDYVSVWDDDILPRTEWLAYCVDYSRTNLFFLSEFNTSLTISFADASVCSIHLSRTFLSLQF
jgi:hypothetical protein